MDRDQAFGRFMKLAHIRAYEEYWFTVEDEVQAVTKRPRCEQDEHVWSSRQYGHDREDRWRYTTCHHCGWAHAYETTVKGMYRA